jgi:hypothetical protein
MTSRIPAAMRCRGFPLPERLPCVSSTPAVRIPTVDEVLAASSATPAFAEAVRALAAGSQPGERIQFGGGRQNPPVKVLRAILWLLESQPTLPVDRVTVSGASGCSDYRGEIVVEPEGRFRFVWDCATKARELGYRDMFGEPDQARAAREYGFRCMESFERVG